MLNDLGIAARGKQMTRVVETLKGEGKLVRSMAENIVSYHLEGSCRRNWYCADEFRLEDHRWLCEPSLHGPRTPTVVREIHVTPARWKKAAGVLQKTGMDCRDGRNSKRLTFSISVRSMK